MTPASAEDPEARCLEALERALDSGSVPDLGGCTAAVLDRALQALVKRRGAAAVPLLRAIADWPTPKHVRKTARLAIYRLEQAGIAPPPAAASRGPVVKIAPERPVRAWLSGIDGTGSRAVWILFEGGLGGQFLLCSLILNDEAGILESAGGAITRKRLDAELRSLREHQKLPWVEADAARACALVREALALHVRANTSPPPEFDRWRRFFPDGAAHLRAEALAEPDPRLLERSAELLELPEFGGWFVDPGQIQEDALALLQARESRLVVSDQVKAEREAAIIDAVIDKQFIGEVTRRWSKRLSEMAFIFRATKREDPARLAECVAAALADEARSPRSIPLVRALALRGLEVGSEVALGRIKLAEVSRAPRHSAPP
jgi:hypothetical protein